VVELRVENTDVAVRYGTRDVDCEDAAVKARVETALERIDVAIADSSFSRALPSVSGVSAGADPLKGT
jgi:cleavage and polyadenylation specificity factor subunit 3